jgi:hypothetical protein
MPYFDGSILASRGYLRAVRTPVYRINLKNMERKKNKGGKKRKKRRE